MKRQIILRLLVAALTASCATLNAQIPLGRFIDPRPVPGLEFADVVDNSPYVTSDGLTIVFASQRTGLSWDPSLVVRQHRVY